MTKHDPSITPAKSGQEVAEATDTNTDKRFVTDATRNKSSRAYWEPRLYREKYQAKDEQKETANFTVRIQYGGRRERFPTGLANKRKAAEKAAKIYQAIVTHGWQDTLEKFHPNVTPKKVEKLTVGDYIALFESFSSLNPRTIGDYKRAFRQIAGDVMQIESDKSRFDYKKGGRQKWCEQIDAIPLEGITPDKIIIWKKEYVDRAQNPTEKKRKKSSANSLMRQAKCLFSREALDVIKTDHDLPEKLPFDGVSFFKRKECSSTTYKSKIDIEAIIESAAKDLGGPRKDKETVESASSRYEQYKIFLLAAFAGLRKKEIDNLLWTQFDFEQKEIKIEANEFYGLKSDESEATVSIEKEVNQLFLEFYSNATGDFVIESKKSFRPDATYNCYRCDYIFKALNHWLKNQGVRDRKPLHTLRKEFGSLINQKFGLYAAKTALRHADIATTAAHYIDIRERVTTGLGALLKSS